ncbi:MAG: methyltransferase domain-containing protein [Deltaproteobacteria bacterium]|nr:MAG: methyltransferase domain-containing protein [Deltaproteobacteria bacterium]
MVSTSESRPYVASELLLQKLEFELARLKAQVELLWPKERDVIARLGLADGQDILELGSGPGFVTQRLLDELPTARVTGLEIDPLLISRARQLVTGPCVERMTIVEGDVMNPPLPDGRFDVAFARYLFMHIPDPVGAARRIRRLLKPGGRLIVSELDAGFTGLRVPDLPEYDPWARCWEQALRKRGSDPHMGRHMPRVLAAAGFTDIRLEPYLVSSDEVGSLDPFYTYLFDADVLGAPLVKMGLATAEQVQQFAAAVKAFLASDHPLVIILRLVAVGRA